MGGGQGGDGGGGGWKKVPRVYLYGCERARDRAGEDVGVLLTYDFEDGNTRRLLIPLDDARWLLRELGAALDSMDDT